MMRAEPFIYTTATASGLMTERKSVRRSTLTNIRDALRPQATRTNSCSPNATTFSVQVICSATPEARSRSGTKYLLLTSCCRSSVPCERTIQTALRGRSIPAHPILLQCRYAHIAVSGSKNVPYSFTEWYFSSTYPSFSGPRRQVAGVLGVKHRPGNRPRAWTKHRLVPEPSDQNGAMCRCQDLNYECTPFEAQRPLPSFAMLAELACSSLRTTFGNWSFVSQLV